MNSQIAKDIQATIISETIQDTGYYFQVIQRNNSETFSGLLFKPNGDFICESQRISSHSFKVNGREKAIRFATGRASETLESSVRLKISTFI